MAPEYRDDGSDYYVIVTDTSVKVNTKKKGCERHERHDTTDFSPAVSGHNTVPLIYIYISCRLLIGYFVLNYDLNNSVTI